MFHLVYNSKVAVTPNSIHIHIPHSDSHITNPSTTLARSLYKSLPRLLTSTRLMSVAASSNHWLSDCLCDLMASPHIAMPPHGGMHLGPGPVDVFTTRFNEYFDHEARGTLCGHAVDREGLKAGLLALQKRWNPEAVKVLEEPGLHDPRLGHHMVSGIYARPVLRELTRCRIIDGHRGRVDTTGLDRT